MLSEGRIPLSAGEHRALDRLLEKHAGGPASITRRDPGETGPVLVHIGEETWQINAAGRTVKLKAAS
jgi:hypothetical protein